MKVSKEQLKSLIKECLVEILQDGIGEQLTESRKINVRQRQPLESQPQRQVVPSKPRQQQPAHTPLSDAIVEAAGRNDIMKSIFADTAATTLPSMLEGDRPGYQAVGHSLEENVVHQSEPADLFGSEQVDKWSQLAFSPVVKRHT